MPKIKIVIGGASGRVGQCLSELAKTDSTFELIAEVGRPVNNNGGLASVKTPFNVFIDFTNADAVTNHIDYCLNHKIAMVIGVTGLNEKQKQDLKEAAAHIPIVFSPNMSIGINLMYKLLQISSSVLQTHVKEIGIAIQEIHHRNKKDSPSGTSLKMGEVIAETLGVPLKEANICFASTRVGEVSGEHNVLFALPGEQLEIKHRTESRIVYAKGALAAAKWLADKPPGLYDMQDVLGL